MRVEREMARAALLRSIHGWRVAGWARSYGSEDLFRFRFMLPHLQPRGLHTIVRSKPGHSNLMYPNSSFIQVDTIKRRNKGDAECFNFSVTFAGTHVDVAKAGDLGSRSELD